MRVRDLGNRLRRGLEQEQELNNQILLLMLEEHESPINDLEPDLPKLN